MSMNKKLIKSSREFLFYNFDHLAEEAFKNRPGTLPMILNELGKCFVDVENNHALTKFIAQNLDEAAWKFVKEIYVQMHILENQIKERNEKALKEMKNGQSNHSTEQ